MSSKTLNFRKKVFAYIYLDAVRRGKVLNYNIFEDIYTEAIKSFRAELYVSENYLEALVSLESTIERKLNELSYLSFQGIKSP